MPKLPVGMFKRKDRKSWYMRVHRRGSERWVSLGADYTAAVKRARDIRSGAASVLSGRVTVGQACERWLETYVQTQRGETSRRTAAQRAAITWTSSWATCSLSGW